MPFEYGAVRAWKPTNVPPPAVSTMVPFPDPAGGGMNPAITLKVSLDGIPNPGCTAAKLKLKLSSEAMTDAPS